MLSTEEKPSHKFNPWWGFSPRLGEGIKNYADLLSIEFITYNGKVYGYNITLRSAGRCTNMLVIIHVKEL